MQNYLIGGKKDSQIKQAIFYQCNLFDRINNDDKEKRNDSANQSCFIKRPINIRAIHVLLLFEN